MSFGMYLLVFLLLSPVDSFGQAGTPPSPEPPPTLGPVGIGADVGLLKLGLGFLGRIWLHDSFGIQAGLTTDGVYSGYKVGGLVTISDKPDSLTGDRLRIFAGAGLMSANYELPGSDLTFHARGQGLVFSLGAEGDPPAKYQLFRKLRLRASIEMRYAPLKIKSWITRDTTGEEYHDDPLTDFRQFAITGGLVFYPNFWTRHRPTDESMASPPPVPPTKSRREIELERELVSIRAQARSGNPPASVPTPSDDVPYAAVARLEAQNISQSAADSIAEILRGELGKAVHFRVIAFRQMNERLSDSGIPRTGCAAQECAQTIGDALGAQRVIFGNVAKTPTAYLLNVWILKTDTGEVKYVSPATGTTLSELKEATRRLAVALRRKSGQTK